MVTTTDQGLSYIQYEADGAAVNFMLTFPYLNQAHIHVYLDGVETFDFTWLNSSEITMDTAPASLALLTIKRLTQQDERIVDFQDGGVIREATLDLDSNQLFYLVQEAIDTTAFNLAIDSTTSIIDAQNNKIINVANGVNPQDAVTMAQLTAGVLVATNAAAAAQVDADAAEAAAAAAQVDASAAVATANAISGTANTALANSATAIATANAAVVTANGIAATANAAAVDAAAAVVTANAAAADATQALADALAAQNDATAALAFDAQHAISNALGSGAISFGGMAINANPAKFDVGALDAWFVDNTTTPLVPTRVRVSLPAQTAISVTNLLTHLVTYVGQNSAGVIIQQTSPFTATQRRTIVSLGVVIHSDHIVVNAINNTPSVAIDSSNQLDDLMESIGPFNISGNLFSANGANLSLNKTSGVIFKKGSNFETDTKNPHNKALALLTAGNLRYRLQDSTEYASTTFVDPTMYDNAGVLTLIPSATRWSIQRINVFQSNLVRIQYGQAHYATRADALAAIGTEVFAIEQNIRENGLLRGYLVVRRNATDLSDTATAIFVDAPRFAGIASGTGTVATLQNAYSNSTSPEILTDSVLGAVSIKRGSAADTDDVLEVLNGAGTKTMAITGEGNIVGAGIVTPDRSDIKQDTKANLDTYALTATNGQHVWATDLKQSYAVKDGLLVAIGGGSGGLSTMWQLIAEENITDWSTGDNATFLGAGAISGTFAKNTATPIQGLASYKYTQAAGSLGDYIASPAQSLDLRFRGRECTFSMSNKYDGADSDIEVIFYDATNSVVLPSSVFIKGNTSLNKFATNIFVPATCLSIRVGFQTRVLNSGKIFEFDSLEFGLDTTVFANVSGVVSEIYAAGNAGQVITAGVTLIPFISLSSMGPAMTWNGTVLSFLESGVYSIDLSVAFNAAVGARIAISVNGGAAGEVISEITSGTSSKPATLTRYFEQNETLSFMAASVGGTLSNASGTHYLHATHVGKGTEILTAPDTFSTDTAPLTYAPASTYTLATLENAPVGTFITFTYAISTNTRTQTTGVNRPTQTDADMNTNGILLYARAYNAPSTSGNPAAIAIQIGKGLKGKSLDLYKSAAKVTSGSLDLAINGTSEYGARDCNYSEVTGILMVDAGTRLTGSNVSHVLLFSDQTSQASGYLVINASKNSALTGMNINAVGARAVCSSGQSIPNNAFTAITWDSAETFDTHNAFNATTGVFTVPESGYYQVNSGLFFTAAAFTSNEVAQVGIFKNGVSQSFGEVRAHGSATIIMNPRLSDLVKAVKGDTIEVKAFQNLGAGAVTLVADATGNFVSIMKTNVG